MSQPIATRSPQGLTEASLLFENVLIIFVIFVMDFASDWILQPVQIYTSIAADIHSKILNHSCHIFMMVNMPADLLYFCLEQPTHCNFCERLDSPAHFDFGEGCLDSPTHFDFCEGLNSPTHFDFCEGLDSSTHFDSCDGNYECFIIADLLNRRTTGIPAAVQKQRRRSQ
jgi:hypothetical protein